MLSVICGVAGSVVLWVPQAHRLHSSVENAKMKAKDERECKGVGVGRLYGEEKEEDEKRKMTKGFAIGIASGCNISSSGVYKKRSTRAKIRRPPQAKGALPIIGHLHLLSGPQLPHHVLGNMAEKHGLIFSIKLGLQDVVVVSNGMIAKSCFTTNDKAFATRPKSEATKLLAYDYAVFGFAPYGEYWRQMRKMFKSEVLSQKRVEMFGHVRGSELKESIKDLYDEMSPNSEMVKVEMDQWFGNLVVNIMVRVIIGKRYSLNDEEGVRFQTIVRKFFELMGAFVVSDFIPHLKCLDVGGYVKAMKKTALDLDNIFEGWLKEHKKEKHPFHEEEGNQVLINLLISILQRASKHEFPGYDHDTVIKSTCQQLLVAGLDTTSGTLTWALALLLNNPNALKKGREEIDEHVVGCFWLMNE
ncbi:hypothetical protein LXL04_017350 [Taraxacum kok-saghyz]